MLASPFASLTASPFASPLAVLCAAVLLLASACGNKGSAGPAPIDDGNVAGGAPGGATGGAVAAPAPSGSPMQEIQQQLAAEFKVSAADIKVRIQDKPAVPGLTVFAATVDPKKLGRNASRFGVLEGATIYVEQEAMAKVAKAWGYGAKRTVSAAEVASVFSGLHSARDGVSAIVNAGALDVFKSTAYPKQAAVAALPAEATVDGLPAVTYCITSGARHIPFSVVTAIFKPDFTVELRVQPVPKD